MGGQDEFRKVYPTISKPRSRKRLRVGDKMKEACCKTILVKDFIIVKTAEKATRAQDSFSTVRLLNRKKRTRE